MEAVSTPFTTVTSSSPRNCSKKRISTRILFSPANQAPLRDRPYGASPEDRFTMVSAAVTDIPGSRSHRPRSSGRWHEFHSRHPANAQKQNAERDLLRDHRSGPVGQASPLATRIEDLAKETEFLVLARPGHQLSTPPELPDLRFRSLDTREFEVSSSEVRNRIRDHLPFQELVPPPVAAIITQRKLYR